MKFSFLSQKHKRLRRDRLDGNVSTLSAAARVWSPLTSSSITDLCVTTFGKKKKNEKKKKKAVAAGEHQLRSESLHHRYSGLEGHGRVQHNMKMNFPHCVILSVEWFSVTTPPSPPPPFPPTHTHTFKHTRTHMLIQKVTTRPLGTEVIMLLNDCVLVTLSNYVSHRENNITLTHTHTDTCTLAVRDDDDNEPPGLPDPAPLFGSFQSAACWTAWKRRETLDRPSVAWTWRCDTVAL